MKNIRHVLWAAAGAALVLMAPALRAENPTDPKAKTEEVAKLLVLVQQADAPQQERMVACRRLAAIGGKEAVPVLAGLLADEKYSHIARFGLEPNPDPSVDVAFRAALGRLKGQLLIGVINSIGKRGDVQAIEPLTKLLSDADAQVASAAVAALGRISGLQAAQTIKNTLAAGPAALRAPAGDAALACAEKLATQGQGDAAAGLCDAVRQSDLPKHIRLAATRGAILARQAAGVPLLVEQLKSADPAFCGIALRTIRELPKVDLVGALVAELDKLPPARQGLLIAALGDRSEAAVMPVIVKAAQSGTPEARVEAIRVLSRRGDATSVAILIAAALQTDADLAKVAQAGLVRLEGNSVDAAVLAQLEQAAGPARPILIDLVGQRRISAATPALFKSADDASEAIRTAALKALGEVVTFEQLPVLVERVLHPKSAEEAPAVLAALRATLARMTDRDACAEKLAAAMASVPTAEKAKFLDLLKGLGGVKALKLVAAAARDADPEVQELGSRVLGEWMTADAAPELLDLAKTAADNKYRVRALRGYIRIARQLDAPDADKLVICREALAAASRPDEKKLVIDALSRIANAEALALTATLMDDPALAEDACSAAVKIGDKMGPAQRKAVISAMEKVMKTTKNGDVAQRAKTVVEQDPAKRADKEPRKRKRNK